MNQNCLHNPVRTYIFFLWPLLAARRSKTPHLISASQGLRDAGAAASCWFEGAEQRSANHTQREQHRPCSRARAPHTCHEAPASPNAMMGELTFYWLFPAKFHCLGLLKDRSIFVALHMPGKLAISPPTAVSTVKYQKQSLQIAPNTRISAVFLTEISPKDVGTQCIPRQCRMKSLP